MTDTEHHAKIKALHRQFCDAIDAAVAAGLQVDCHLDTGDRYGGGLIRSHDPKVTRVHS